eukprot:PhF_6_TR41695/c0_g1_i2/m.63248/K05692/ACTB_G1; actin beta/gamma 1
MCDDVVTTLAIDIGSYATRSGFSTSTEPSFNFRTRALHHVKDSHRESMYIGEPCTSLLRHGVLREGGEWGIVEPVDQGGIVQDWDTFTKMMHHSIAGTLPDGNEWTETPPLIMTERLNGPKANREKLVDTVFETFNAPSFYLGSTAVFGLFATGRTTGMAVDIGHTCTLCTPVYEGYGFPMASLYCVDVGGRAMTSLIASKKGMSFEHAEDWKHKNVFVPPYSRDCPPSNDNFAECLFHPDWFDIQVEGCAQKTRTAILKTDIDIRKDMYYNIVLQGGCVKIPGFRDRFTEEIQDLAPVMMKKIQCALLQDPATAAWKGMSMFASLSTTQAMSISKAEYEEHGPTIVFRKCY